MGCIILMGIKHCGKSTQGRLLSERMKVPFFDTDKIIEDQMGMSAREIYTKLGEMAFKNAETQACQHIVDLGCSDAVIATGGGICNNKPAIDVLRPLGTFVFLVAPEKIAADRIVREAVVQQDGKLANLPAYIAKKNPRDLNDVRAIFHDFYEERIKIYSDIADVNVVMDNAPKSENMERILSVINV